MQALHLFDRLDGLSQITYTPSLSFLCCTMVITGSASQDSWDEPMKQSCKRAL